MVFQIKPKGFVIHSVDCFPHKQSTAVSSSVVQSLYRKYGHKVVNIFFADKIEQILRTGFRGKCYGIQKTFSDIFGYIDVSAVKSFVQKATVGYYLSGKDYTARLCYADGFTNSLLFVFFRIEMIKWTQKQCDIVLIITESR